METTGQTFETGSAVHIYDGNSHVTIYSPNNVKVPAFFNAAVHRSEASAQRLNSETITVRCDAVTLFLGTDAALALAHDILGAYADKEA